MKNWIQVVIVLSAPVLFLSPFFGEGPSDASRFPSSVPAKKSAGAPDLEVYNATESETGASSSAPKPVGVVRGAQISKTDVAAPKANPKAAAPLKTVPAKPAPVAKAAKPAPVGVAKAKELAKKDLMEDPVTDKLGYDPVPNEMTLSVLRRLQLVERLLLKHHRAYDYRTMTTMDLERVLGELEAKDDLRQRLGKVESKDLLLEPKVGVGTLPENEDEDDLPLPAPPSHF